MVARVAEAHRLDTSGDGLLLLVPVAAKRSGESAHLVTVETPTDTLHAVKTSNVIQRTYRNREMTWIDGGDYTSLTVNQLLSRTPSDEKRELTVKANYGTVPTTISASKSSVRQFKRHIVSSDHASNCLNCTFNSTVSFMFSHWTGLHDQIVQFREHYICQVEHRWILV